MCWSLHRSRIVLHAAKISEFWPFPFQTNPFICDQHPPRRDLNARKLIKAWNAGKITKLCACTVKNHLCTFWGFTSHRKWCTAFFDADSLCTVNPANYVGAFLTVRHTRARIPTGNSSFLSRVTSVLYMCAWKSEKENEFHCSRHWMLALLKKWECKYTCEMNNLLCLRIRPGEYFNFGLLNTGPVQ